MAAALETLKTAIIAFNRNRIVDWLWMWTKEIIPIMTQNSAIRKKPVSTNQVIVFFFKA